MADHFQFEVRGEPQPKGSMRAFMIKNRPVLTASNPKTGEWAKVVKFQLQDFPDEPWVEPVEVGLTFYVSRPKSLVKKVLYPARRPDIDKLIRAVLDAMTGIIFHDDGQVVKIQACKLYGQPGVVGWAGKYDGR